MWNCDEKQAAAKLLKGDSGRSTQIYADLRSQLPVRNSGDPESYMLDDDYDPADTVSQRGDY